MPSNIPKTLRRIVFLPPNATLNFPDSEVNSVRICVWQKREIARSCNSKVSTAGPSQKKVLKI